MDYEWMDLSYEELSELWDKRMKDEQRKDSGSSEPLPMNEELFAMTQELLRRDIALKEHRGYSEDLGYVVTWIIALGFVIAVVALIFNWVW